MAWYFILAGLFLILLTRLLGEELGRMCGTSNRAFYIRLVAAGILYPCWIYIVMRGVMMLVKGP